METNWQEIVNYDDLGIPEVLYKFRCWGEKFHPSILKEQIVFLSAPSGFTDKLDCKIPIKYELRSHREQNRRFFDVSLHRHPHWKKKRHKMFAKKWMKRTPLRNPKLLQQKRREDFDKFDKMFGVLCLTPIIDNYHMWNEYACLHQGFSVGFAGKELFRNSTKFGMTGNVEYYDTLPIIHPNEDFLDKANKQTFSKEKKWESEYEYRTTKLKPSGEVGDEWRKVKIEKEKFVEIVFGAYMSEEHKQEIIKLTKGDFPNIKFRQAEINTTTKTVNIKDLNI